MEKIGLKPGKCRNYWHQNCGETQNRSEHLANDRVKRDRLYQQRWTHLRNGSSNVHRNDCKFPPFFYYFLLNYTEMLIRSKNKSCIFLKSDPFYNVLCLQKKTAEEKAKDSGMMSSLVTKIVDNLQIKLTNMHIRIENEDAVDRNNQFSLGVTL